MSYTYASQAYDSLYLGSRYGEPTYSVYIADIRVRSHRFGTGFVYYNKPKFVRAASDTTAFYPTYNYYVGLYANNIFVTARQFNVPEESDFYPPLTWAAVAGYSFVIGQVMLYPAASYQYQGGSVYLSGHRFINDIHVFDVKINAVKDKYLLGLGGRQISDLEHMIFAQAGYSFKRFELLYSFGVDVLNREEITRHQFTIGYNRKTKKPPRKWKGMGLPEF